MKKNAVFTNLFLIGAFIFAGCAPTEQVSSTNGLVKVTLQTDWYAQAEHGGFYQAVAEGYYEDFGLDVTILPGGPNAMAAQKTATGKVEFAIGRADDVVLQASNGVPILIVGSFMQHDPQAILLHEESSVNNFEDLDGRSVMTTPGAAMIKYLEKRFDITIETMPVDYGMSRFLADKEFIQQCFITSEPYYIRKEGANPKTLLIADSGYDPYRVMYTSKTFAQKNTDVVKAFVEASVKGWKSYIAGPRDKANEVIAKGNPKMTEEFLSYSLNAMIENQLISGYHDEDQTGLIDPDRMQALIDDLFLLGVIEKKVFSRDLAPISFLPEYLQEMIDLD